SARAERVRRLRGCGGGISAARLYLRKPCAGERRLGGGTRAGGRGGATNRPLGTEFRRARARPRAGANRGGRGRGAKGPGGDRAEVSESVEAIRGGSKASPEGARGLAPRARRAGGDA